MADGRTATVVPPGAGATAGPHQGSLPVGPLSLPGGALVAFTGRNDGDMADRSAAGDGARRRVVDVPWTVLRQVHGATVVDVDQPGARWGEEADAAVATGAGRALAVLTADCAPVALSSPEGVIGVAHAGWKGLAAGVLDTTVARMRSLGATSITAVLGPCIRTACYEFGAADLDAVVAAVGPEVRGTTSTGTPALDLAAGVHRALGRAGVAAVDDVEVCTACSADLWSHRARRDTARQATVVWR